ncbi:MiaB/RimO family radical SAM methylthiotransferase [Patescibacteria group bacterium]|nr:MiaB/RimO family radical SAM methylthiotransferase [Patescibacteria group bacterium]
MKYNIITYGCQMNESDSERIVKQLNQKGYQETKKIGLADLSIINICSVKQSAINRVYSKIKKIRSQNPKTKIILTGCILKKDKQQFKDKVYEIWPIADFKNKPEYKSPKSALIQRAWNKSAFLQSALIPIMTGCNNFCSYCVVPYTRGREQSRSAKEIIKEIECLIKKEYKEIILLGQNVNSYSFKVRPSQYKVRHNQVGTLRRRRKVPLDRSDLEQVNFPQLLQLICDIPGNFTIKFLTSHPKDMSDELIGKISKNEKISKEIHLPIQSGDNEILKKMNRGYTVQDYKKLIKKIKKKIPQAKISTDIIIGFPDETEKQFQNTVNLVKEMNFTKAYVSAYSPRNGTNAAKLKDNIPANEKKRRKRILRTVIKSKERP